MISKYKIKTIERKNIECFKYSNFDLFIYVNATNLTLGFLIAWTLKETKTQNKIIQFCTGNYSSSPMSTPFSK